MVTKSRARSGADKLERRMQILDAALELWEKSSYVELTMAQVAEKLQLAKGTLYLYFPSKEELFLAIYIQLLDEWFDQVELGIEDLRQPTVGSLAKIMVEMLVARPNLARIIPLAAPALERNASIDAVREYRGWLGKRYVRFGEQVEDKVPGFPPGTGPEALTFFLALSAGVGPMSELASDSEFQNLKVEFGPTLVTGFTAILVGLQHKFR